MKKKNVIISISTVVILIIVIAAGVWIADRMRSEKALKENRSAEAITEIFHDQANEYMTPLEPTEDDDITIRLRTEKYNVTKAQIQYTTDQGKTWKTADMSYEKRDKTGYYDYFVGTIPAQKDVFYYRFICANEKDTVYVTRELSPSPTEDTEATSGWSVIPGYSTPSWAKGALWYNINPDAFYNGNSSNDVTTSDGQDVNTWNYIRTGLADKYGGDLAGIEAKVDHIKGLYVDAVFLNPFNKSLQNGGYDPAYYNQVEPSFGNAEDLKSLVNAFHEKDMKIGSDAVMTFTTNNSIYFDQLSKFPLDGAYESESSEWSDLYLYYNWPENYHSTWGQQPAINHDNEATQKLLYSAQDSFLQYYTRDFGIDTWRFDCGGWLAGWTETGSYGSSEVISKVAENLKEINPEVLLVSENCSTSQLMEGEWDSHWNIYFMKQMKNYAEGLIDENAMSQMLRGSLNALPRPMALSIYNLVCNHDEARTGDVPTHMETAQILTMMNYIGSPSIYYGDEINLDTETEAGLGSSQSFYAMNWDESDWDYERYSLYRSLGELRSKYSALKTGAFRELLVDSENSLYAFGRWNDEGTVITVASQNKDVVSVKLNARKLGVANGTVFTDWMTGAQYKVDENGILKADILPGGGVLVEGTESSEYREEYIISVLSNADSSIRLTDTDEYVLEGEGRVSSADKLTLASTALYGAGSIQAIASGDGEALLTIREGSEKDSAAYLVVVTENKLIVKARTKDGGKLKEICEAEYKQGSAVKVVRSGKNSFSVQTAEASEKGTISGKWKTVEGSTVSVGMHEQVCIGFAPMKNTVKLQNVQVEQSVEKTEEAINYDSFDGKVLHAIWSKSDADQTNLKDGNLVLSSKDGITWLTTEGKKDDWSFKAKIDSTLTKEGTYAGVVSKCDDLQWVAAGRTVIDGKSVLFVGRTTDGSVLVDSYVEDTEPESSVIVQLQRVGSEYAAVYSYDDKTYRTIDERIFANYSCEHAGVFVAGEAEAAFDYACFGDSIHDEVSYNTPHSEGMIHSSYSDTVGATVTESLEIVTGKWEYGAEGYYQTEKTEIGQMGICNKTFGDFRLNVTLQIESGKGWAGIGFGKNEYNSNEKEGFLLEYTADGELLLLKNGEKLAKAKITSKEDLEALRIVLEVKDSNISVYAGQLGTRVIRLTNTGYQKGAIAFYTGAAAARFMNSRFTSLDASWINVSNNSGGSTATISGGANRIQCVAATVNSMDVYGAGNLNGIGVTDFVTAAKVSIGKETGAEGGILTCAPIGKSKTKEGINVALMNGGILMLRVDGKDVAQYALGEEVRTVELMIVKKDKVTSVYVRGVAEPVLSYTDTYSRGGAYQFYSAKTTAEFVSFALEDIHNIEIAESTIYQTWQQGKLPTWTAQEYRENFNNTVAYSDVIRYYTDHGTWTISEGTLSCISSPQWASGVTFHDSVYNHFNMELKYRFNEASNAWTAVLLHKQRIDDHNESTPYSVLLSSSGEVILYESSSKQFVQKGKISGFKLGEWYQLEISCKGDTLTVSSGGNVIFKYSNEHFKDAEGFLSLMSNKSMVSFDDILIQPAE